MIVAFHLEETLTFGAVDVRGMLNEAGDFLYVYPVVTSHSVTCETIPLFYFVGRRFIVYNSECVSAVFLNSSIATLIKQPLKMFLTGNDSNFEVIPNLFLDVDIFYMNYSEWTLHKLNCLK